MAQCRTTWSCPVSRGSTASTPAMAGFASSWPCPWGRTTPWRVRSPGRNGGAASSCWSSPGATGEPRNRRQAAHDPLSPQAGSSTDAVGEAAEMGLGAGGRMRQKIYPDPYGIDNWLQERAGRVFVHIANAELFTQITGKAPPPSPVSAKSYADAGLPWFDLYDADKAFVAGSDSAHRRLVRRGARRGEDRAGGPEGSVHRSRRPPGARDRRRPHPRRPVVVP